MKTIAEEPVQQTGECYCCCKPSNSNTPHSIGYQNHCIPASGGGDGTSNNSHGVNYIQTCPVHGNQISATVSSPVNPAAGDSASKTSRENNNATGVTATITTRKKVNNNNNLNAQDNRRQRYYYLYC